MSGRVWPASIAFAVILLTGWIPAALGASYSEDAIKAAFLHRFAAYVQWPTSAPVDAPFVIGVIDADEVVTQLRQLLPGLTIQNRRAEVRTVERRADLEGTNILYVGRGHLRQARELVASAVGHPILLVTDEDEGLANGGIINFVRIEQTIRFEVSLTAAERSGLKINSGLLSVAARVEGQPQASTGCTRFAEALMWRCGSLLASRTR